MRGPRWLTIRLALAMSSGLGATAGLAAELCVTCSGPDATYRCVLGTAVASTPEDPAGQVLCIRELAKFGHHESCAVDRRPPAQCPGMLRAVSPPEAVRDLPPLARPPAGPMGTPMPLPVEAKPKQEGPRTVEELAKGTAKSTGDGIGKAGDAVKDTAQNAGKAMGKAGDAVGSAAKKSWHCLTSFFTDC